MKCFHLKIVTPEGISYDGQAESVTVNTITGYLGILAGHIDMTTALGKGEARVMIDGVLRTANCQNGLISVQNGEVTMLPAAFHWTN